MAKEIKTVADLIPDHANANKGTERGRHAVEASLRETGAGRSIVVDKNGKIIAGNKTLESWSDIAGDTDIEIVRTDGKKLVVVQREDLDLDDVEGLARKLAYYDNRAGQLGLEWDAEQLLSDIQAGVDLSGMFFDDEIEEILSKIEGYGEVETGEDPGADVSKADELQAKWNVQPGDLWQLGDHRLICGDCTDAAVVERVMDGEKWNAIVTDPPYGVDYEGGLNEVKRQKIEGDKDGRLYAAMLDLWKSYRAEKGVLYLWFASTVGKPVFDAVHGAGYQVRAMIVWNKLDAHYGNFMAQYMQKHEPCLYCVKDSTDWYGPTNEVTVWDIKQPSKNEHHPTEKPLECMARPIQNSTKKGDIVAEPFSGSGTTLIACEQLGRKCRAAELHPPYVAVALQRWADMTGKTPTRIT